MSHVTQSRRRVAAVGVASLLMLGSVGCSLIGGPHERGSRHLKSGNYEEAVQAYTEAIEAGDNVVIAYANRCYANQFLGQHQEAIDDCTKSLELASEQAEAGEEIEGYSAWEVLNNRAVSHMRLGAYDDALADLDEAVELMPDYAEAYANRGRVLIDRERFEEAIEVLDKAVELDPELAVAYGNRGLAYESLGDDKSAIADYTKAVEISKDPQAFFNRGMLKYSTGYFDDAYDDFQAVIENVDHPDSYLKYQAEQMVTFLENRPKGYDPETGVTVEPDD